MSAPISVQTDHGWHPDEHGESREQPASQPRGGLDLEGWAVGADNLQVRGPAIDRCNRGFNNEDQPGPSLMERGGESQDLTVSFLSGDMINVQHENGMLARHLLSRLSEVRPPTHQTKYKLMVGNRVLQEEEVITDSCITAVLDEDTYSKLLCSCIAVLGCQHATHANSKAHMFFVYTWEQHQVIPFLEYVEEQNMLKDELSVCDNEGQELDLRYTLFEMQFPLSVSCWAAMLENGGCVETSEEMKDPQLYPLLTEPARLSQSHRTAFAVVRHTERADAPGQGNWFSTEDFKSWPTDPPLSGRGWEQAQETGVKLREKAVADNIIFETVVCSPYYRCVQTAVRICCELEISGTKPTLLLDNSIEERCALSSPGGDEPRTRPLQHSLAFCEHHGVSCLGARKVFGIRPSQSESSRSAQLRFQWSFVRYLLRSNESQRSFVMVTHGEGIAAALRILPSSQALQTARIENGGFVMGRQVPLRTHPSFGWELVMENLVVGSRRSSTDSSRILKAVHTLLKFIICDGSHKYYEELLWNDDEKQIWEDVPVISASLSAPV